MSEDLLKYQCTACGGPLHFDVNKQLIICDYCDSEYTKEYFKEEEEGQSEKIDWNIEGTVKDHEVIGEQSGFICSSCGAEIVSDGNTVATECMYCGNPVVITNNVSGMVKPDMVLPFKIDKVEAEKLLKQFYNKKFLLPSTFKDQNRISKIVGMYIPFWLFTGKGEGDIVFDARNVKKWTSGEYRYTETKIYHANRAGDLQFEKVPVDASKKMLDNYMDGLEPYDYNDLKSYSSTYMAGYFADKFDVSVDECSERAKIRIVNSTIDTMKETVTGYSTVSVKNSNIKMSNDEISYVLLPVWMLNTKYKDKMYQFAINGQTGKVSGELPIDKLKKNLLFAGIALATFIPSAILGYNLLV